MTVVEASSPAQGGRLCSGEPAAEVVSGARPSLARRISSHGAVGINFRARHAELGRALLTTSSTVPRLRRPPPRAGLLATMTVTVTSHKLYIIIFLMGVKQQITFLLHKSNFEINGWCNRKRQI